MEIQGHVGESSPDKVGFWADMENPYVTYDNDFIESEWWALKQIWDKELAVQGLQDRSLLPPLRYSAVQPRGCSGLQGCKGTLRHRSLQGEG